MAERRIKMILMYIKNLDGVWFGTACSEAKVFATAFAFDRRQLLRSLFKNIPFNVPFQHLEDTTGFAEQVLVSLRDIYHGRNVTQRFHLATDHLPKYSRKVLETVALIPAGYVASYGSVAKAVGGSPRSVGRVMASNPFPLIIPCHRVIASNYSLGGYGGGVQVKLEILSRERRNYSSELEIPVNEKRLRVSPVEFLLFKYKNGLETFSKRK